MPGELDSTMPVIHPLVYDIAHLLAGGMVLVSFMLLYQDRMHGLLNVFAFHAVILALSVAWEALVQRWRLWRHSLEVCPSSSRLRAFA